MAVCAACDDDNPFENTSPRVVEGEDQVWELGLPAFPSGWDFSRAQRIFVGTDEIGGNDGSFLLDARTDGTLVFRPFSTFLAPGVSSVRTGILDLGSIPYESVDEVPESGYSDVNDSTGVAVQAGHVYAFRITQQQGGCCRSTTPSWRRSRWGPSSRRSAVPVRGLPLGLSGAAVESSGGRLMLDVRLLREERDRLSEGLAKRGEPVDVDRLVRLDEEYRRLLAESERLKAERNTRSKEIGEMMRTGQKDGVEALKSHMRAVADRIKALDEQASAHKTRSTRCSSRFRTCRIPRCPREAPKESARPRVGRIAELRL